MTKEELAAWAGTEMERVAAKASQIDDVGSDRYGKALENLGQLRWLTVISGDFATMSEPGAPAPVEPAEPTTSNESGTRSTDDDDTPIPSLADVRTRLAAAKKAGVVLTEVLKKFGASTVSGVDQKDYKALLARVEELQRELG